MKILLVAQTMTVYCKPSTGNKWALRANCLHMSYVFAIQIKETSAENVVQAYLPGDVVKCIQPNTLIQTKLS